MAYEQMYPLKRSSGENCPLFGPGAMLAPNPPIPPPRPSRQSSTSPMPAPKPPRLPPIPPALQMLTANPPMSQVKIPKLPGKPPAPPPPPRVPPAPPLLIPPPPPLQPAGKAANRDIDAARQDFQSTLGGALKKFYVPSHDELGKETQKLGIDERLKQQKQSSGLTPSGASPGIRPEGKEAFKSRLEAMYAQKAAPPPKKPPQVFSESLSETIDQSVAGKDSYYTQSNTYDEVAIEPYAPAPQIRPRPVFSPKPNCGLIDCTKGAEKGWIPGIHDSFVQSKSVFVLNRDNFSKVLKQKDAALVFFYDPEKQESCWSRNHVLKAAKTTKRKDHIYTAVNCVEDKALCDKEDVSSLPFLRIYSRGHIVGSFRDFQRFDAKTLKAFVEASPVLEGPIVVKSKCALAKEANG